MSKNSYNYDAMNVLEEVKGLAEVRLSEPHTVELTVWEDDDFRVQAFHTIDATYPFEAEARGEEKGLPFYRERVAFSTTGDEEGWLRHEVVRCYCGETAHRTIWSDRIGGYTPDWPAPLVRAEYGDSDA